MTPSHYRVERARGESTSERRIIGVGWRTANDGVTKTPRRPADFARLDEHERAVHEDLVTDRLGPAVRLEQERIDGDGALTRLH